MSVLEYITWDADPIIFTLGMLKLRWYGLFFGASFFFGYYIIQWIFKKEGVPEDWLDKLTLYMVFGTFLGARLGHCLFYEPEIYLADPIKILMVWEGGLASHGAAIGIISAMVLFSRRVSKRSILWVLDRIVIVVALSAVLIRLGNIMNSEIVGNETEKPWGFVFQQENAGDQSGPWFKAAWEAEKVKIELLSTPDLKDINLEIQRKLRGKENWEEVQKITTQGIKEGEYLTIFDTPGNFIPMEYRVIAVQDDRVPVYSHLLLVARHPTQLYESFAYAILFLILIGLYIRQKGIIPQGQLFGLFLSLLFGFRFFVEFLKEEQVGFEEGLPLNMGQMLSVPFFVIGLYFVFRSRKKILP